MRAVARADVSREARAAVQSSLARQTWLMEERERFEARRWGMSVSRGEGGGRLAVGSGMGVGEGGWRDEVEVEEAMVRGEIDVWGMIAGGVVSLLLHALLLSVCK